MRGLSIKVQVMDFFPPIFFPVQNSNDNNNFRLWFSLPFTLFFSEEKIMMNDVESFPAFDDDDCDLCSHVERGQESI